MSAADPIRHVVLLMLENRSFDQMLGDLKSVNADIDGIDRAHPNTNIDPKTNAPIAQQPIASYTLPDKVDIGHEPDNVDAQLDLKDTPMSGFVGDFRNSNAAGNDDGLAQQVMAYYPVGVGSARRQTAGTAHAGTQLHRLRSLVLLAAGSDLAEPPVRADRHLRRLAEHAERPAHRRAAAGLRSGDDLQPLRRQGPDGALVLRRQVHYLDHAPDLAASELAPRYGRFRR